MHASPHAPHRALESLVWGWELEHPEERLCPYLHFGISHLLSPLLLGTEVRSGTPGSISCAGIPLQFNEGAADLHIRENLQD